MSDKSSVYRRRDREKFEAELIAAGTPPDVIDALLSLYSIARALRGAGDKIAREVAFEIARRIAR